MAQSVKNPPAMWETWVWSLCWEKSPGGEQPTPVLLPGESPWTEEPGGLQSMGSQRVRHDWATKPPPPPPMLCICVCRLDKHSMLNVHQALPHGSVVKNSRAKGIRDAGLTPGFGRSPGEGNDTHSSILVWEIPRTEKPGYSPRGRKELETTEWLSLHFIYNITLILCF